MEKTLLEKIGQEIFKLKNPELKDFIDKTKINKIYIKVYEFEYNGSAYIISSDNYNLECYAIKYVENNLLPQGVFNTDFILELASLDKTIFYGYIFKIVNDNIQDIKNDLKQGEYLDVLKKINIPYLNNLHRDFENKKILEKDFKKEIEKHLYIFYENITQYLINKINQNPIECLNELGYSNDDIAKELQKNKYFRHLFSYHIAERAIRSDGVEHILSIKCVSSFDNIKVYERQ